MAQDIVFRPY